LAGQERIFERSNDDGRLTVSELARSLHTDRPNLTRAIKAAQNDPSIKEAFDRIDVLSK
jgi:ParB-like chromosome segregation protein Spo0J